MLRNLNPEEYDVALIQEPVINTVNLTTANPKWNVVYPTTHNRERATRTRSVILVNKLISKDNWQTVPLDSPDVTAIELRGAFGKTRIYNVYNDITHGETLTTLENHFADMNAQGENHVEGILLMGDFNRHHPMWDEARNQHLFTTANLKATQPLLELLIAHDLVMVLPENLPTLEANFTGNHTRLDSVFCTSHLLDTITICDVRPDLRPTNTDHYPIITEIDLSPERTNPPLRKNYRATNWENFEKYLNEKLTSLPPPAKSPQSRN